MSLSLITSVLLPVVLTCFIFSAAAAWLRKISFSRAAGVMAGLLLTIAAAAFILEHARVPLAGAYESLLMLLWTAAVLIYAVRRTAPSRPELLTAGLMLGILSAWLTFGNLTPNHDVFLYASGCVQAFFFFRLLAAGVMLTTGLAQAAGTFNKSLFMAGFLLFLVSEFTGSVWCFRVWG